MSPAVDRRPLSALTVSPSAVGGGAEKVALSLHQEYLARGIDSWLALGCRNEEVPQSLQIPNDDARGLWARTLLAPARSLQCRSSRPTDAAGLLSRALRIIAEPARYARVARGHEDFDFPESKHLLELPPRSPDVVHLHTLHGSYFNVRDLRAISAAKPTLLTLHDVWLLTGHCAYPLGCEHWRSGCGDCPDLSLYVPIRSDSSADNWRVKRAAVRASRLAIATPSQWLLEMVQASDVMHEGIDARCIPNGVDTRIFRPAEKAAARRALGLPDDARIAVFAARGLRSSQYKGFQTLTEALRLLSRRHSGGRILFVAIGEDAPAKRIGDVEVVFLPFNNDPAEVARHYQAADVYVHPALAENLPLAIIEAMACGTAVVASEVGGIPELVVPNETGLLFPATDPGALASAVETLLGDESRRSAMGAAAVTRVESRFTLDAQVDAYLAWYAELVENHRGTHTRAVK
jgi:glycosyltransferase involved in cell wall biosynthesis